MKLLLTKTEAKRGILGGKMVYTLFAKLEVTPEEDKVITKYWLGRHTLYESLSGADSAKQFMTSVGGPVVGFAARMFLKRANVKITGSDLLGGQSWEEEEVLALIDMEEKVKEAANLFAGIVLRMTTFMGEEAIDLPMV